MVILTSPCPETTREKMYIDKDGRARCGVCHEKVNVYICVVCGKDFTEKKMTGKHSVAGRSSWKFCSTLCFNKDHSKRTMASQRKLKEREEKKEDGQKNEL